MTIRGLISFILVALSVYALGMSQPIWAEFCDVLKTLNPLPIQNSTKNVSRSGILRLKTNIAFRNKIADIDDSFKNPIDAINAIGELYLQEIINSLPTKKRETARKVINNIYTGKAAEYVVGDSPNMKGGIYLPPIIRNETTLAKLIIKAHEFSHYFQRGLINPQDTFSIYINRLRDAEVVLNPLPRHTSRLFKQEKEAIETEKDLLSILPKRLLIFGLSELHRLNHRLRNDLSIYEKFSIEVTIESINRQLFFKGEKYIESVIKMRVGSVRRYIIKEYLAKGIAYTVIGLPLFCLNYFFN